MARPVAPRSKAQPEKKADAAVAPARARRLELWVCVALFFATLAVYAQVARHEFVLLDDMDYVGSNEHVRAGLTWDGVAWAFTSSQAGNWFPLTWISHMVDCQVFGVDSGKLHLMNVLYHALAALLVFAVFMRMTGAVWRSAFVAFLFALHPLHTESVAWMAERKDVLSALLWFLTVWAYLAYVKRPGWRRYAAVLGVFVLALMAKSMVVTLPLALLLLDYWPLRRMDVGWGRLLLEKAPLLALSLGTGAVTYMAQQRSEYVMPLALISLSERVGNALVSVVAYIGDMFWPARLAVLYPFRFHVPVWQPLAAGAAILGVSVLAVRAARRRPYLAVGWFWYLVTLIPVIGLVQVGSQARADRYTYIPMVGLTVAVAWGAAEFVKKRPGLSPAVAALAMCVCLACATLTWRQVGYWQDTITLFQRTLSVTSGNYLGYNILGLAFRDRDRLDEAIASYREAIRIYPAFQDAHVNLSKALLAKGRPEDWLNETAIVAALDPNDSEKQYNLGVALAGDGRFEDAIVAFRAAVRLKPDYAKAHANLGSALASLGQLDEAIEEFTKALRIDPGLEGLHDNLDAALDLREQQSAAKGR
jgi:tetratricopeptide (TPR) repeat protein